MIILKESFLEKEKEKNDTDGIELFSFVVFGWFAEA